MYSILLYSIKDSTNYQYHIHININIDINMNMNMNINIHININIKMISTSTSTWTSISISIMMTIMIMKMYYVITIAILTISIILIHREDKKKICMYLDLVTFNQKKNVQVVLRDLFFVSREKSTKWTLPYTNPPTCHTNSNGLEGWKATLWTNFFRTFCS